MKPFSLAVQVTITFSPEEEPWIEGTKLYHDRPVTKKQLEAVKTSFNKAIDTELAKLKD